MATLASKTGLNEDLQVCLRWMLWRRGQNNPNGLIKIITGFISKSEKGTEGTLPGKAKY